MNYKRNYFALLITIAITTSVVMACKAKYTGTNVINIVRRPEPADFTISNITEFPLEKIEDFEFDVRSGDLSSDDLTGRINDLLYTTYDSKTKWPEKLPEGFNPVEVMEIYKNPGLNLRKLHAQGITGKGVGIAIIDQTLLVDHIEYKDRIKLYEEYGEAATYNAQMHGSAIASIAVGKTVGVAPEANLYYIAESVSTRDQNNNTVYDFTILANNIDRILEINKDLSETNKIRVISAPIGWNQENKGYKEITEAVNRAKEAGIFVVSSSLYNTYGYMFHGLGKYPMSDADNFESYKPGSWWEENAEEIFRYKLSGDTPILLIPMEFRCTAAPNGVNDYVVYASGGLSWSIPYIAGVYALACQVDPDITYDEFWNIALETGKSVMVKGHDGKEYVMEKIINPEGIIESLK